jgi:hypothetical protein
MHHIIDFFCVCDLVDLKCTFSEYGAESYIDSTWKETGIVNASLFYTNMISVTYRIFVSVVESGNNSERLETEAYTQKYIDKLLNEF